MIPHPFRLGALCSSDRTAVDSIISCVMTASGMEEQNKKLLLILYVGYMPAVVFVSLAAAAVVGAGGGGGARNLVNWKRLLDGFLHLLYHD